MRRFLKKLFYFLFIGIAIAYLLQWVIDTGLRKSNYSVDYKVWYQLFHHNINADILVQGSSRAKIHISPLVLEKQFKQSAYNLGLSGSAFGLQYYRFCQYIKYNRKPKYIIQAVDIGFFANNKRVEPAQFLPYLNKPLINRFEGDFAYTTGDLYIPLYKYRDTYGAAMAGFCNVFRKGVADDGLYKGFRTYDIPYSDKLLKQLKVDNPNGIQTQINDRTYREFVEFINYCRKENITLVLVWPPSLQRYQALIKDKNNIPSIFTNLAKKYNLSYFNYSDKSMCNDTSMFFDYYHMNKKGVEQFDSLLIGDLKTVIH